MDHAIARRLRYGVALPLAGIVGLSALTVLPFADSGLLRAQEAENQPSVFSEAIGQRARTPGAQMLVDATEIVYDFDNEIVTALGNVALYYDGDVLRADRVVYEQKTRKVRAVGNVQLNERDGNILYADSLELTDDFREGFIETLRIESADNTRYAASRATRVDGRATVFDQGVYTACAICTEEPEKPPLWQVKAARIIHDEVERMIYYEDARLEFLGVPIAYVPFFSHPDPTVKRKSGFLAPRYMASSEVGVGVEVPYFWAIAPNMDVTVTPGVLSRQGFLGQAEFRHRLSSGSYAVRAAGISQENPGAFAAAPRGPGNERERGALQTEGRFHINPRWSWGWDVTLVSDRWFLNDYDLWKTSEYEATSTIDLTGIDDKSRFEARAYHFRGFARDDRQRELPFVAPVVDYDKIFDRTLFGGEVSYSANLTSLTRATTDFEPTARANFATLDPAIPLERGLNLTCLDFTTNCIVRGSGGSFTRASQELSWRRQVIDPVGQVWTPFAFVRGDMIWNSPDNTPALANFINTNDTSIFRGMAGVGVDYRFPLVAMSPGGAHVVEPMAQVIFRPDERRTDSIVNEDAQSLFFDDTTLFARDKFSGWDRMEGGSRANLGLQYTFTGLDGTLVNAMVGQSYQLFGRNSFAAGDLANTGLDSGLETTRSDYVTRFTLQPTSKIGMTTRMRFDEKTLDTRAVEVEGRYTGSRGAASLVYGRYDAQPRIGFTDVREGVIGTGRLNLNKEWYVTAGARYDIDRERFDRTQIGIGADLCDCFAFNVTYQTEWNKNGNKDPVHRVYVRAALRTLGDSGLSTSFGREDEDAPNF